MQRSPYTQYTGDIALFANFFSYPGVPYEPSCCWKWWP